MNKKNAKKSPSEMTVSFYNKKDQTDHSPASHSMNRPLATPRAARIDSSQGGWE